MVTEWVGSEEQGNTHLNALAKAASAYLRSAKHQPVEWQQWGEDAFAQAAAEDKPILLDIGAVWCHWCHVMDRESYEDAETAKVINDHFVAVKVDRDERPDVDTRYQAAVSAISGQGGWPLTAFLTPDGKPFFGGTYFPPEDRHGRPSFRRVLLTMAEAFQDRRSEVDESAGSVMRAIEHNESFMGRSGNPGPELVAKLVSSALKQFDARSGGFGSQPKFPHSGAIDLLLDSASRVSTGVGAESAKTAAMVTLQKMSKGGIYDHLAGGFHRYSVDDRWVVPHFEKMAYDNSELLKNYVHAFQTFVDPECARVAREMIQWIDEWLSDRERGGFYASQDADYSLDDDGDYFTWTRDEAAEVLTGEELAVASAYYDIGEIGDMHHNPAKNVLHVRGTLEGVAKSNHISLEEAKERLASAKTKLYAARLQRPTPYVDKTIYVAWNGMMISAYLEAGRVLDMPEVRAFALKSLDRVIGGCVGCVGWNGACGCVWRDRGRGGAGGGGARRLCGDGSCGAGCVGGDRGDAVLRGCRRDCGECGGSVLRSGGPGVLRHGGAGGRRAEAGSADGEEEAAAGFAYSGWELGCGGVAATAGGSEWARGLCGEGARDAGDICWGRRALWAVCGELWAGVAANGPAVGAGVRDWR